MPYVSHNEKPLTSENNENFTVHNIDTCDTLDVKDNIRQPANMKRSLSLPVQKNNISSYFAHTDIFLYTYIILQSLINITTTKK
jgi:hypothetical protein